MTNNKTSFKTGIQQLFNPQAFIPFVIATLMLAILGAAVYDALKKFFGGDSFTTFLIISLLSLTMFLITAWFLSRFINRLKPAAPLVGKQSPEKHKGLILLVSNEVVCRRAIEWHKPELKHCWLICSSDPRSIATGNTLKTEMQANAVEARIVHVDDVYNPIEFRVAVNKIYEELAPDLTESDVILDFTGMTTTASVGSVLACLSDTRPIQYVPAEYKDQGNGLTAMQPLDPVEVILEWRMLDPSATNNPPPRMSVTN